MKKMKKIYAVLLIAVLSSPSLFASSFTSNQKSESSENYLSIRVAANAETKEGDYGSKDSSYGEFDFAYTYFAPGFNYGYYMKDSLILTEEVQKIGLDVGASFRYNLLDNLTIFASPYISFSLYYSSDYSSDNYYFGVGGEITLQYQPMDKNFFIETGLNVKSLTSVLNDSYYSSDDGSLYSISPFIGICMSFDSNLNKGSTLNKKSHARRL
jgi:hypothetical protein